MKRLKKFLAGFLVLAMVSGGGMIFPQDMFPMYASAADAVDQTSVANTGEVNTSQEESDLTGVEELINMFNTAEDAITGEYNYEFEYEIVNGMAKIIEFTKFSAVAIPDVINGCPVVGIGSFAFSSNMLSIIIPDSVRFIEDSAFDNCYELTSVTLGTGVASIGAGVFSNCPELQRFKVPVQNPYFSVQDGVLFNKAGTVLVAYPGGRSGAYTVPNTVTEIKDTAFSSAVLSSVEIPNNVKRVGKQAFYGCGSLVSLQIGTGMEFAGGQAFSNCQKLQEICINTANPNFSVQDGVLFNKQKTALVTYPAGKSGSYTIPNTVATINDGAFDSCKTLQSVEIPASVKVIGNYAFAYCSALTSLNTGAGVESIGDFAFSETSLTKLTFGAAVSTIGEAVFIGYRTEPEFIVDQANPYLTCVDGVLFDKNQTILYTFPKNRTGDYTIPSSVTKIWPYAFQSNCLTNIVIHDNLKYIGKFAFRNSPYLNALEIPGSVKNIEEGAFTRCSALSSVTLGEGIETIGKEAFRNDNIKNLVIPNSVKKIDNGAFYANNYLESLDLGNGVETIGDEAFRGGNYLTELVIPNSVKTIGDGAFIYNYYIANLKIGNGVESIGSEAFSNCNSLTTINIRDSVISIGSNAFYRCYNVTNLQLGNSVQKIGSYAFESFKITEVTIPESIISMDENAFDCCNQLKKINFGNVSGNIDASFLGNCPSLTTFIVDPENPYLSVRDGVLFNKDQTILLAYPEGYKERKSYEIPTSVTQIGKDAFSECYTLEELTVSPWNTAFSSIDGVLFDKAQTELIACPYSKKGTLTIPDTVKKISQTDWGWRDLSEITIGSGVRKIQDFIFERSSIQKAVLKDGIESIGAGSFCRSPLLSVVIPGSVKTIDEEAFDNCKYLNDLTLEEGIENIGPQAFIYCSELTGIEIPDSVKNIQADAFDYCNAVEVLDLGQGVTSIGTSAFRSCGKLTEINIPDSVTEIGAEAFGDCRNLQTLVLGNGLQIIDKNAFAGYKQELQVYCYENSPAHTYAKTLTNARIHFIQKDLTVTNLNISSKASRSLTLNWNKPAGCNINEYIVYRDGQEIARTQKQSYSDSGLTTGQEYTYEIAAVAANGDISPRAAVNAAPEFPGIQSLSMPDGKTKIGGLTPVTITATMNEAFGSSSGVGKFYYSMNQKDWIYIGNAYPGNYGKQYTIGWNLVNLTTETYFVKFVFTDKDNLSKEKVMPVEVDRTPPQQIFGVAAISNPTYITLSWGIAADIDVNKYRIYRELSGENGFGKIREITSRNTLQYSDSNTSKNQVYKYYIVAVDEFGQQSEPSEIISASLCEDSESPRVTELKPATGTVVGGSAKFEVRATDNVGVTKIELYYSTNREQWVQWKTVNASTFSATLDTREIKGQNGLAYEGIVYFKALAYDKDGNVSDGTPVYMLKTDLTGPEKVTNVAVSAVKASTATLSWKDVADNDLNYFVVEKKDAQGVFTEYSRTSTTLGANLSHLTPGTSYTFRVVAYDKIGNRGIVSDEIVFRTQQDTTAPVVTKILPEANYFNQKIPLDIRVWDDSGLAYVTIEYSRDLSNWQKITTKTFTDSPTTAAVTYDWNLAYLAEGTYYIRAVATDLAGLKSDQSVSAPYCQYIVDKTAPAVPTTLQAIPQNGAVELRWTQEDVNCAAFDLYRADSADGQFTLVAENIKSLNCFDQTVDANVTYFYKLKAKDRAGNISGFSTPVSGQMQLDTEIPVILSISPASGSVIGPEYRTISVLAEDNNRLASVTVQYKTNGDYSTLIAKENINKSNQIVTGQIPLEGMDDGTQVTIRAIATDIFGNQSVESLNSYTVDKTAPAVAELTTESGMDDITLKWTGLTGEEQKDLSGYRVFRRDAGSTQETLLAQFGPSEEAYSFTDLQVSSDLSYYYRVEAVDMVGNTSSMVSQKVNCGSRFIIGAAAPKAKLEIPDVMETGVDYKFDASKSVDETEIASYNIDFGDGTTSAQPDAVHRYAQPGDYAVTLSVTDNDGNTSQIQRPVVATARGAIGTVQVEVLNSRGAALANMPVYFNLGNKNQAVAYTGANGTVKIQTVVGETVFGTFSNNYLPTKKQITVRSGKENLVTLIVVEQPIVTGSFETHRMTLSEIKAAGIDVTKPENQNIVQFTGYLFSGDNAIAFSFDSNEFGVIDPKDLNIGDRKLTPTVCYRGRGGGGGSGSDVDSGLDDYVVGFIDVPMTTSFLKDFFDVKLHVLNHTSSAYSLKDNIITLNVPQGMSLMNAEGKSPSATVKVSQIQGQKTYTAEWMLRGDVPGSYMLSANYSGVLSQFNAPVQARFVAKSPLQVRNGTGMEMILKTSDTTFRSNVYFDLGIRNSYRDDTYLPNINVDDATLLSVKLEENGVKTDITEIPEVLEQGQTIWKRYKKEAEESVDPNVSVIDTCGKLAEIFGMPFSYDTTGGIALLMTDRYPDNEGEEYYPAPGTYCIKILDSETKFPIPGVYVVTNKGDAYTDANGIATLTLGEDNSLDYLIYVKKGYNTVTKKNLLLSPHRIREFTFTREKSLKDSIGDMELPDFSVPIQGPSISNKGETVFPFATDFVFHIPFVLDTVKMEIDNKEQKIKVAIGLNPNLSIKPDPDDPEWKESYNSLKNVVERFGGKETPGLQTQFDKIKNRLQKTSSKLGFDASTYYCGYMEFSNATGELKLISGGFVVISSLEADWSTPIPGVPGTFISFTIEGGIESGFQMELNKDQKWQIAGKFALPLTIGAGVGIGCDDLGIEVGGEGHMKGEVTVPYSDPYESLKLTLGADLYIEFSYLIDSFKHQIYKWNDFVVWPPNNNENVPKSIQVPEKKDLKMMSRDYLSYRPSNQPRTGSASDASYYKQNVFPSEKPQLLNLGNGKQLLVWVDDNPQRSDANRTELYYAVYNGTSWSQAQSVYDDGTGDFAPRLCRDGDTTYLVWQNFTRTLSDSVGVDEMLQSTDLCLSVFNGTSFSIPVSLNPQGNLNHEMMHRISAKNNEVTVVWVENSDNDPLCSTGTNSIYRKKVVNGQIQEQECLKNGLPMITKLDAAYDGNECVIAFTTDMDGNVYANEDTELFLLRGTQIQQLTKDSVADVNLQFLNGNLYWNAGGVWKTMKNGLISELGLQASADAMILENGSKKAAIWKKVNGYKNEIVVSYENPTDGSWTMPIPLTNDGGKFRSISAFLKEDGEVAFACKWTEVLENSSENKLPSGRTDLIVMQKNVNCDLVLDSGVIYDNSKCQPGQTVPLTVSVKNNSLKSISSVDVSLTDGNGTTVLNKNVACNFVPGETKEITVDYTIPNAITRQQLTLRVLPSGCIESNVSNNSAEMVIGEADLVLSETSLERSGNIITVKGIVTNSGYDTAKNVKAVIYKDGVFGEKITEIPLANLAPNGTAQISYQLPDVWVLLANENDRKLFYIQVESDASEAELTNNSADMVLEPVWAQGINVNKSNVILRVGEQVQMAADVFPAEAINPGLYWVCDNTDVAVVDENTGLITAVGNGEAIVTAMTSNGKTKQIAISVNEEDFVITMKFDGQYSVYNGKKILNTQYGSTYASMTLVQGVSMIPLRFLCEITGLQVGWDGQTNNTTVTDPDTGEYLCIQVNSSLVKKYNAQNILIREFNMPAAAQMIGGITKVPLRAVSECMGYYVEYVEKNQDAFVVVSNKPQSANRDELYEEAKKLLI